MADNRKNQQESGAPVRPQTAQIRSRKAEDLDLLNDEDLANAQSVFDRELNELLAKN